MLIDTHILLWPLEGFPGAMGADTLGLVREKPQSLTVSAASLLEICLKQRKGGLKQLPLAEIQQALASSGTQVLDITAIHLQHIPSQDESPHSDPFDLLLVAQSISEATPFLTCDEQILSMKITGLHLIDGRQ
jgi:PIN domain nuclease of toxin-antitoxin system